MSSPCQHPNCGCHSPTAQPLPKPFTVGPAFVFKLLAVFALIGFIIYLFFPVQWLLGRNAAQAKALADARFIVATLRIYAHDYQGRFPAAPADAQNANAVYQQLIPHYLNGHKEHFHRNGSGWTPKTLGVIGSNPHTLAPGENHYAYTPGLSTATPRQPVVADGFAPDTPGSYTREAGKPGFVEPGKSPVIIGTDGAAIAAVVGEDLRVYRKSAGGEKGEALFGGGLVPLNPLLP